MVLSKEIAINIMKEQKARFLDKNVDYGGVADAYDMAIECLQANLKANSESEENKTLIEIKNAIRNYERKYFITPNVIYVADKTYEKIISEIERAPEFVIACERPDFLHFVETLYGLRIKISQTIKDGFVIVNELT